MRQWDWDCSQGQGRRTEKPLYQAAEVALQMETKQGNIFTDNEEVKCCKQKADMKICKRRSMLLNIMLYTKHFKPYLRLIKVNPRIQEVFHKLCGSTLHLKNAICMTILYICTKKKKRSALEILSKSPSKLKESLPWKKNRTHFLYFYMVKYCT